MAAPDRWTPWCERKVATGDVSITVAGELPITGASITVTPHVDTRVLVVANFRLFCDFFGSITGQVRGLLRVNGVTLVSPFCAWAATIAGANLSISHTWAIDLPKETLATLELLVNLANTADSHYTVKADGTGLSIIALPNLHS